MRDIEEIKTILKTSRECGVPSVVIDGVKYEIAKEDPKSVPTQVPDVEANEIVKSLSVFDELTEEEIKYWATPYFDVIQEQKANHQEAIKNGVDNGKKESTARKHDVNRLEGEGITRT